MARKPLNSILVKPAGPDCNLACEYCFYTDKSSLFGPRPRMEHDTLEVLVRNALAKSPPTMSFGWQGGEPTLMGLEFFKKAAELQDRYGNETEIDNCLQTNGILIDDDWARWLAGRRFLTGVSIDGPEHVHDRFRGFPSGKGTWSRVRDNACRLLDAGAPVNALTVVGDYAADFPHEIYEHHKEMGIYHMQFIPLLEPDPQNPQKPATFSVSPEKLGRFWRRTFDLWWDDFQRGASRTYIRFFEDLFYCFAGMTPPDCSLLSECGVYVVVEHNGDVYSCDFFVGPEWRLGNIRESGLAGLLNSGRQKEFGKRKARLPKECLDCKWLSFCGGGCPRERGFGGDKKSFFCSAFKEILEHSRSRMQALAKQWKAAQKTKADHDAPDKRPGRNDPCPCGSGLKYKKCCGR